MFFLQRYNLEHEKFIATINEINSWSIVLKEKAINNRLNEFQILDSSLREILLEKAKFILKKDISTLSFNSILDINKFFNRRFGVKGEVVTGNGDMVNICTEYVKASKGSVAVTNDYQLLTLIETILVFSKTKTIRKKLKKEILAIFNDNGSSFDILEFLIVKYGDYSLQHRWHLLKPEHKEARFLFEKYYEAEAECNYIEMAKKAADIERKIFIGSNDKLAQKIIDGFCLVDANKTTKQQLKDNFSARIKNNREITDKIFGIRHTENWTIEVNGHFYIYKMIASSCLDLVTVFINATQKDFFAPKCDAYILQEEYLKEFPLKKDSEIDVEDIPF